MSGFLNKTSRVSAKTHHKIVDTAKAHASAVRCVSRQPFFLVIYFLLEFAVREDIKKAGCSTVQRYYNSPIHPNVLRFIYGLIAFYSLLKDSDFISPISTIHKFD